MNINSCTPSPYYQHYLFFLAAAFLLNLIITSIVAAVRASHIIAPELKNEEFSSADVLKCLTFSTSRNIEILHLSSLFFSALLSVLTIFTLTDIFCVIARPWITLLIMLCAVIVVLWIEALISGIAARHAIRWTLFFMPIAKIFLFFFSPLYRLYEAPRPNYLLTSHAPEMKDEKIQEWMESAPNDAPLRADERKMVRSILHFGDTLTREIMIPRIEMTAVDADSSLKEAAEAVLSSGHSRLPVYEDEIDNIIGMLYAKDLLKVLTERRENDQLTLRSILREPIFVPEAKKAGDLLSGMQSSGVHIVVVVDEYGGTAGIVSMEDIVEEIVGEIRDEYDEAEEELVREITPDEFSFLGRIDLDDVNELLGTHFTRDAADTLAGFMYSQIGKMPVGDEVISVDNWDLFVEELTGNRIRRVLAKRKPLTPSDQPEIEEKAENES